MKKTESISTIKKEFRPKKSLGQNFLIDTGIADRIVESLRLNEGDLVVEVGPGKGILTQRLIQCPLSLVAIELDDQLYDYLAKKYAGVKNVRFIHNDVLNVDFKHLVEEYGQNHTRVIGNIPYGITSPLIFHLLSFGPLIEEMILMVQKEMGERITSPPGSKRYGALSISVQYNAEVTHLFSISKKNFSPVPKVDSSLLRVKAYTTKPYYAEDERLFRTLVQSVFSQRRKQMQKILRKNPKFNLTNELIAKVQNLAALSLDKRAEELSVAQFVQLSNILGREF